MLDFVHKANEYGSIGLPFFFLVDFELEKPIIMPLDSLADEGIFFDFEGQANSSITNMISKDFAFEKHPVSREVYTQAFVKVLENINYGNSYLTNLTFASEIECDLDFETIFANSEAKFKLLFRDEFVCFSPEIFVKIIDGKIFSYPMKGTIPSEIPNALEIIMADKKEEAEHNTIVDLIRNDLSIVSEKVEVLRFRYPDYLHTNTKNLIQISSEICGSLSNNWQSRIGNILAALLPAGSVSGAPKKRTLDIIAQAESDKRGYYTGVAGIFDGNNLTSCVLIRFIENRAGKSYFRSGGGITSLSDLESEYQELIDKIYVPIHRNT
ncbi:MAG: aminodeoxychorismate synthase component I [Candidatus Kapabacteria bacterium]|nr:aminodeoxychorismate synthase component I [Candidatus Kapabacteria bacterium]